MNKPRVKRLHKVKYEEKNTLLHCQRDIVKDSC